MTIPEGATDVILSYVRRKAAEWTVPQMLKRVQAAHEQFVEAARAIPEADLERVPAGQEWSPLACMRHAVEVNTGTAHRVSAVVSTGALPAEAPPSVPADRDGVVAAQESLFAKLSAALANASEETAQGVAWEHPYLGDLNWREWLLTLRVHCLDHGQQMGVIHAALGGEAEA